MKFICFLFLTFLGGLCAQDDTIRSDLKAYVNDLVEAQIKQAFVDGNYVSVEEFNKMRMELEDTKRKLKELTSELERKSEKGHSEVSLSKRLLVDVGSPIGFTACVGVPDLVNLGDKHTIVFDMIIANIGGAYHNHTGIFFAPVRGIYVFHLTAMSVPNKEQYLAFVKDGVTVNHAYPDARGTSGYQTTGSHWVMELQQGSEVWIRTLGPGEIHGNCFTVFSGFLLQELE